MSAAQIFNKASTRSAGKALGWALLAAGIYHWGGQYQPVSLVAAFGAGVSYLGFKVGSAMEEEEASPPAKPRHAAASP